MRRLQRRYGEAERGREGLEEFRDGVAKGVEGEQLGARANKRTVLLTAAHVARPPPVFANTGMSRRRNSHSAEEIIALGDEGYSKAITSVLCAVGDLASSIDIWGDNIARLPGPAEGEAEDEEMTGKRQEYLDLVDKAKKKIEKINKLHSDVGLGRPQHSAPSVSSSTSNPSPSATDPTSLPATGR